MYGTADTDQYGSLPMFPALYGDVSEERIERAVERIIDVADHVFLNGGATQAQYDAWMRALDAWATKLYRTR